MDELTWAAEAYAAQLEKVHELAAIAIRARDEVFRVGDFVRFSFGATAYIYQSCEDPRLIRVQFENRNCWDKPWIGASPLGDAAPDWFHKTRAT